LFRRERNVRFHPKQTLEFSVLQAVFYDPSWSMGQRQAQHRIRSDGWTADRQLRFLDALAATRSVIKAAAFARMSRESAYRLRERKDGALFAALWDRAVGFEPPPSEVHTTALTNGRIMRLLGNHYRRQRGDFLVTGSKREPRAKADRTLPL
jgi:hypothetical protein